MTYLVTGGAGFIGSNIVKEILARGERVRVLDNFATGKRENLNQFEGNPLFELHEGDLRSALAVQHAAQGVDYILHQAALPSVPRSIADPLTTNEVNITGTLNVLEAARASGVKRVVFASSSSVYGDSPTLPKHEEMPVQPLSPYALSKYAGERYCQIYYRVYGLETVCLRYFNVFGPSQDPGSQYSAVIPKFIKLIAEGTSPSIYGDGLQTRDFTFVSNNIEANLLACTAPNAAGEAINIACGERHSLIDLIVLLNKLLKKDIAPTMLPERAGEVKHSMADISKAKRLLGFQPKVSIEESLQKTILSLLGGK